MKCIPLVISKQDLLADLFSPSPKNVSGSAFTHTHPGVWYHGLHVVSSVFPSNIRIDTCIVKITPRENVCVSLPEFAAVEANGECSKWLPNGRGSPGGRLPLCECVWKRKSVTLFQPAPLAEWCTDKHPLMQGNGDSAGRGAASTLSGTEDILSQIWN